MPTRSWLPLLALLFGMGALFRLPWLVYLAVCIAIVIGISRTWVNMAVENVTYSRKIRYRRGFPGEKSPVSLEIENRKLLPMPWVKITDPWPYAAAPEQDDLLSPSHQPDRGHFTGLFSLKSNQKAVREFDILFKTRGVYPIGPAYLESSDLFGLYEKSKDVTGEELLTVFPELLEKTPLDLPAHYPFGNKQSTKRIYEDPNRTIGVRDYHPEDEFRRVHWPATAHTGKLQVKIYEPVTAQVMMICMNVATTSTAWMSDIPDLLEQVIRVCATIAYDGIQNGYAVGLISNSCLAHSDQPFRVPPGRSPQQLSLLLQTLAGATSYFTGPFEPLLFKSMSTLPMGSSLVIVTGVMTDTLVDTLIRLKKYHTQTTLISLEETPPPAIHGIRLIHLPFKV
ncbi:MAG: DUF58 domain-containing protein [Anaerolineaceae bacterium]|nr:DUF58 domain-containing protein [Anaerolineaceae bacterium]NTV35472.1 DUF58 domain-containing protein [Anaerolineaceae bacterium]